MVVKIFWMVARVLLFMLHSSNNNLIKNGSNISSDEVDADIWVTLGKQ